MHALASKRTPKQLYSVFLWQNVNDNISFKIIHLFQMPLFVLVVSYWMKFGISLHLKYFSFLLFVCDKDDIVKI